SKRIRHVDRWYVAWQRCRLRAIATVARCLAGYETAVVSPIEAEPWSGFPRLILQVRRLVEFFVMVNAEGGSTLPNRHSQSAGLGREEARGHARHHYQCRESVEIRHAHANGVSRNLGIVPSDGKEDRRGGQRAEIVAGVRVLPNVVPADHRIAPERLLQARMEVVAKAWRIWLLHARDQIFNNSVIASFAGQHKVLIERTLQGSRIGNA